MVKSGASESLIKVCFAPGMDEPLSVDISSDRKPPVSPAMYFRFEEMRQRINLSDMDYDLTRLGSFYNPDILRA